MKTKILFSLLVMIFSVSASYASFPVPRTATAAVTTINVDTETASELVLTSPAASSIVSDDTFLIAILLFLFLWPLAAHRWYLGSPIGWNILFILTFGGFGIWALVDLIDILTKKYPGL
jgi:hypothetical protein